MLTTKEAAEYLNVSMPRIRQLIGEGRLVAQRTGKSWLVDKESLDKYRAYAAVGRPTVAEARWRAHKAPVHYTLMSRNHAVAECFFDPMETRFTQVRVLDADRVPLALCSYQAKDALVSAFNTWWRGRGIPNSRQGLSRRLRELDLDSAFELPLRSYGLSLSDQYWLLSDDSSLTWDSVAFFRNAYDMGADSEDDGMFSQAGPWMNAVGLNSPDNTTDGMLNKRWILDEYGKRLLIKGNGSSGREVYNEIVATMLYRRLLPASRYVEYRLANWRGNDVCVCENFLRDDEEFIPAWYVFKTKKKSNNHSEFRHYCEICEDLGIDHAENQLTRMLVCDSILANTDRHWGNFGVIRNIETLEYRWAPIFDTGMSLWTHVRPADLVGGDYAFQAKPFYKEPKRQLDMLIDASWYDPAALEGFSEDVRAYLSSVLSWNELADAIAKGIDKRINAVNAWARKAPTSRMHASWMSDPDHIDWIWL